MPTIIYNTIAIANHAYDDANSALGTTAGNSFSTLATTTSLSRVGIYLLRAIPANNGTVKVSLVANNPNFIQPPGGLGGINGIAPGAILSDLGSISDTALTAGYQTFYFLSDYPLSPSTRYWIMLTDISIPGQVSGVGFGWISYNAAAVGIVGEWYWDGNSVGVSNYGSFPNLIPSAPVEGPYQIIVEVNP